MATANRDIYDPFLLRVIQLLKQTVERSGGQLTDWQRLDYIEQNQRYYTLEFRYLPSQLNPDNSTRWALWANNAAIFLKSDADSEFGNWHSVFSLYQHNHLNSPETMAYQLFTRFGRSVGQAQEQKPVLPDLMPVKAGDATVYVVTPSADGLSFSVSNGDTFSRSDYDFDIGGYQTARQTYYAVTTKVMEKGTYVGEPMEAVSTSQELIITPKELEVLLQPPQSEKQKRLADPVFEDFDALINQAREVDLIGYVEKNGWLTQSKKIVNAGRYVRADGFAGTDAKITFYRDTNSFVWWNNDNVGGDVICFVQTWQKTSFRQAVEILTGQTFQRINRKEFTQAPAPKKELVLPQRLKDEKGQRRLFGYLCKARGVASAVVQKAIKDRLLYQGEEVYQKGQKPWREAVAVFTGRKEDGSVGYASIRSLHDQDDYHYFVVKRDCTGSEKQYGWVLGGTSDSTWVIVCEAPIDALSIATMMYERDPDHCFDPYILALGGCADVALEYFLAQHPKVTQIEVCTDHDTAGLKAAHYIQSKYQENAGEPSWTDEEGRLQPGFVDPYQRQFSVYLNVPKEPGRDWNEILKQQKGISPKSVLEQSPKTVKEPQR